MGLVRTAYFFCTLFVSKPILVFGSYLDEVAVNNVVSDWRSVEVNFAFDADR